MACYRSGGCGPYEMYSCSECPASKSEYAQKQSTDSKKEVRLIDADALEKRMEERLNALRKEFGNYDHYTDGFEEGCVAVEDAETIDPESLRPKPQTNADRLRAMADGELANFLASKFADCQASNAFTEEMPPTATQLSALAHSWYCAWMQWLRQPIKEGADNDA